MAENKKYTPLEIIGAISVIISVILGGKELYEAFSDDVSAVGIVTSYQSPPFLLKEYKNSNVFYATLKFIEREKAVVSKDKIDSLIKEFKSMYRFNSDISKRDSIGQMLDYDRDYGAYWYIKIKNKGNQPIEELVLQLDTGGYCSIKYPDKKSTAHAFVNKINLGKLNPSYEITVKCWSIDNYDESMIEYKDIKLAHKNGWTKVSFPNEKSSFMRTLSHIPTYVYIIFGIMIIWVFYPLKKKREINPEDTSG